MEEHSDEHADVETDEQSSEQADEPTDERPAAEASDLVLDPLMIQVARERLIAEQSLLGGALAGLVAALAGALGWAGVTILSGRQIGWMAVAVGFLVGIAVRAAGKGVTKEFGVLGAGLALLGCLLGNLLSACYFFGQTQGVPFQQVLAELTPERIAFLFRATFKSQDLLFYGIAVWEGYRLSTRTVSEEELIRAVVGDAARDTPPPSDDGVRP